MLLRTGVEMKKQLRTNVYSHRDFEKVCASNEWTDDNVSELNDKAFISICCSDTSREGLCETVYGSRRTHYFKEQHSNVINIDFDDVEEDTEWSNSNGSSGKYVCISDDQAKELYEFIKKNIGRNFYIHCSAGVSRSQAVGLFIREFFPEFNYGERESNPCVTPNNKVLMMLKRCWYSENYEIEK